MQTTHLFLGSIGVLAETSDIQRRAYNTALAEAGVPWAWTPDTYRSLLTMSGGQDRLRMLADATNTDLDDATIIQIHRRKTEIACAEVVATPVGLRPGVAEIVAHALDTGVRLGLVTSTYMPNIEAISEAAGDALPLDRFDVVVSRSDVARGKPAPDAYLRALEMTGADASTTVAIEDTAASALAARGAGLRTIVVPGRFTDDQIIVGADAVLHELSVDGVFGAVPASV
ncbi:MAG: HAD-IA family hydrolase [Actinomycetota bacterium]